MPTAYPEVALYINGSWRSAEGSFVINPADETCLGQVPHVTRSQLEEAADAAVRGFRTWSRTSPAKRAEVMLDACKRIRERVPEGARIMTLEQGKPLAQAEQEIIRGCELMEWDAAEGRRAYGRVIPSEPGMRHTVLRQPIGPVAAFAPWNFPFSSPARKVGGALASGCSVILKASEETPATAMFLVRAFHDAGLPAGVLNLVFGVPGEISEYLVPHPGIRLVTFTGSVPVGKQLAALAGSAMKPCIMELGGHSPVIVCDDFDPVAAGEMSALVKSRNAGQVCISPTRFFVEDAVYDAFVDAITRKAASFTTGPGLDPSSDVGPLANARRLEAIEALVADARQCGGRITTGGARIGNRGYFYPVTVVAEAHEDMRAMREEPFGPLALVSRVRDLDEALERANAIPYGLASYGFTNDARKAERLADEIAAGMLSINHLVASVPETPFGGVRDSGYGREGGVEGLQEYSIVKNVSYRTR